MFHTFLFPGTQLSRRRIFMYCYKWSTSPEQWEVRIKQPYRILFSLETAWERYGFFVIFILFINVEPEHSVSKENSAAGSKSGPLHSATSCFQSNKLTVPSACLSTPKFKLLQAVAVLPSIDECRLPKAMTGKSDFQPSFHQGALTVFCEVHDLSEKTRAIDLIMLKMTVGLMPILPQWEASSSSGSQLELSRCSFHYNFH